MRDIAFGQYYPTNSAIHRLDARAKIIFTLFYVIGIFFVESFVAFGLILLFLILTCAIAKIPFRTLIKTIKGIIFLIAFTSIINLFFYRQGNILVEFWIFRITDDSIRFMFFMSFRLILLIMGTNLITLTTTPMELTDAIEALLKPLKYIKVPVHDIAIIMSIALRFIPGLIEETDKIIMAQKSRGSAFDTGGLKDKMKAMVPILIPLFMGAFRRADELADALDSRCYKATDKRTKYKILKFTYRDVIAFFVICSLFTLILLDKYLFLGVDRYVVQFIRTLF